MTIAEKMNRDQTGDGVVRLANHDGINPLREVPPVSSRQERGRIGIGRGTVCAVTIPGGLAASPTLEHTVGLLPCRRQLPESAKPVPFSNPVDSCLVAKFVDRESPLMSVESFAIATTCPKR